MSVIVDLSESVTQQAFGEMVGISQQAVSDLMARGVLADGAVCGAWLRAYCGHIREVAAGRATNGDLDLATERARLAKEQADKVAMQNAVTRGELAPAYLIEEVLSKAGAKVAGILDAIPGQVRRMAPELPGTVVEVVAREIAKARNVAAAVSLQDLEVEALDDDDVPTEEAA